MTALALGLGATSSGELLELQLTQRLPPQQVAQRMQAALPPGLLLRAAGEFPVRDGPTGRMLSLGLVVSFAEYLVLLAPAPRARAEAEAEAGGTHAAAQHIPQQADWTAWVAQLLKLDSFSYNKRSSKKSKQARCPPHRVLRTLLNHNFGAGAGASPSHRNIGSDRIGRGADAGAEQRTLSGGSRLRRRCDRLSRR